MLLGAWLVLRWRPDGSGRLRRVLNGTAGALAVAGLVLLASGVATAGAMATGLAVEVFIAACALIAPGGGGDGDGDDQDGGGPGGPDDDDGGGGPDDGAAWRSFEAQFREHVARQRAPA